MFEWITSPEAWVALATLTALEIVLGIDNIIFISILSGRLPKEQRPRARTIGLAGAMLMRVALLLSLAWVAKLTVEFFMLFGDPFTARDVILVGGGLFLLAKATFEIHHNLEGDEEEHGRGPAASFAGVIAQIMILDIVFSLDSVITAIGMVDHLSIMVIAVVSAMIVMIIFANPVGNFVERHPSIKILALAFLVLIGVMLTAEGTGRHVEKGYIYFAMAFSLLIEVLNMRYRKHHRNSDGDGDSDADGKAGREATDSSNEVDAPSAA